MNVLSTMFTQSFFSLLREAWNFFAKISALMTSLSPPDDNPNLSFGDTPTLLPEIPKCLKAYKKSLFVISKTSVCS